MNNLKNYYFCQPESSAAGLVVPDTSGLGTRGSVDKREKMIIGV